jgi:Pyruvate/2-oxoacid:ferredoxin oxidoreductase delta subunit
MMSPIIVSTTGAGAAAAAEESVVGALASAGRAPIVLPHLYHLPESSPNWDWLRALSRPVHLISWLQPRAAEALLVARGITQARCRHMLDDSPLAAWLPPPDAPGGGDCPGEGGVPAPPDTGAPSPRWYPVMDKPRCVECRHCLDFCLFGVYELCEGKVVVAHPDRCKHGCPACARICASSAIMFPLYQRDPAISGAPGQFVAVGDEARALYQKRTGKGLSAPAPAPAEQSPAAAELDDLVADLERFSKGRRP